MTMSKTATRQHYPGDGATASFGIPYRYFRAEQIAAIVTGSDGVERTLARGVDYSLSGDGASCSGVLTLLRGPLASGDVLGIVRRSPPVQTTDFRSAGAFLAQSHEDALDYLTMLVQELLDLLGSASDGARVIRLEDGSPADGSGAMNAGGHRISHVGDPLAATDAATLGTVQRAVLGAITGAEVVLPRVWRATGDGAATGFPIAGATLAESAAYDVAVGGVLQRPDVDYVVHPETETIAFDAAPPTGVDVVIVCRGYAVPVPQPPWYTTETLPEATAGMGGKAACVRDAGCAGYEVVCLPDESGAWHWYRRTVAVPAF